MIAPSFISLFKLNECIFADNMNLKIELSILSPCSGEKLSNIANCLIKAQDIHK